MSGLVSCFILATTMILCTYIAAIVLAGIILHAPEVSCQVVEQDIASSNSSECSPSCLTLSEYINKVMSSQITIADNISLVLKSGNHFLTSLLIIKYVTSFSILTQAESTVVTCSNHSAGFRFANVTTVKLINITFSGCGSIHVYKFALLEFCYVGDATIRQCNITSSKGLVVFAYNTSIKIATSSVINPSCDQGVTWFEESTVIIEDSLFFSNKMDNNSAFMHTFNDGNRIETNFENNSVARNGIIQLLLRSKAIFVNIKIIGNQCRLGILYIFQSSLEFQGKMVVSENQGILSINTIFIVRSTVNLTSGSELLYSHNRGKILLRNSKAIFSGLCTLSCNEAIEDGGAIAAIYSKQATFQWWCLVF